MERVSKNYRNGRKPPILKEYDGYAFCFDDCLITREGDKRPHRIFPDDDTPRTFINCNLVNAMPPPGSKLTDCNTTIIERDLPTVRLTAKGDPELECIIHGRTNPDTLKVEEKETKQRIIQ